MVYLLMRLPLSDLNGLNSECGIIKKLVEEKAQKLIMHATAQKRLPKTRARSIHEFADEDTLVLEIIPEHATFYEYTSPHFLTIQNEQKTRIHETIEKMPANLGELCELLQDMTVTEVHRFKGISRQSLYRSIKRIRCILLEADTKIYA
jgi:hypothetical protein